MKNLITISNVKENVLEFDVEIKGIDTDETTVRFIIEVNKMKLSFDCEKGKEEKLWSVKIPALSILETTSYPFHIDVIVDGYYFDAMKGSINVVGTHEIYTTKPKNITLAPFKKKEEKVDKKPTKEKSSTKDKKVVKLKKKSSTKGIAEKIIQSVTGLNVKKEKTIVEKIKDDKIITEELNTSAKPKKEKIKKLFSLMKDNYLKETIVEKTKDDKINKIIAEDLNTSKDRKKEKTVVEKIKINKIKKINKLITEDHNAPEKQNKEKTITEKTKDDKIKEIITKELNTSENQKKENDTKTVTTKPFIKKGITIH